MSLIRTDFYRIFKNPWLYAAMILCLIMPKVEDGTVIILPILATLPMSNVVYLELKSKIAHTAVFKSGRRVYIASKCIQLLASGFLVGLMSLDVSRILGCIVFAVLGGIFGMITKDIACVLGVPCAISFGLWLFSKKFLASFPIHLYNGDYVLALSIAALLTLAGFCLTLYRQVKIDAL